MTIVELKGRITNKGKLEVELPQGLPAGEVTVRIEVHDEDREHQPWTEDEIRELIKPKRQTFRELVAWLDKNPSSELWGDMRDDESAADYIHRVRCETGITLDEPGEAE
jgi:hypothetical protein